MVRAAAETATSASISTPVRVRADARLDAETRLGSPIRRGRLEPQLDRVERDHVRQRDPLVGALRGLDAGDARGGQYVALGHVPGDDPLQGGALHAELAARHA